MYKHNLKQLEFEIFNLPFYGKLRSDNRWVKLAKFIPWEEFEVAYAKNLSGSGLGPPAMSVRIAMGALTIKEKLGTFDEETVEQIRENPYLQYKVLQKTWHSFVRACLGSSALKDRRAQSRTETGP